MTKDLITIKENTSVRDAIKLLIDKKISGLPVVKDDMSLIGIITEKDLLQLVFYDSMDDAIVGDIMTRDVLTMHKDTDLYEVCEFFMQNNYKRVPVVSDNKLVGILSRKDMLKYILRK